MKINKAFKFRIYSNSQQKQFLAQSLGCVRFVYNHFLRQRIDYYAETGKGLTYHNNALALTQLKKQPEFEWLNNISAQSLQQALRNLDVAYNNIESLAIRNLIQNHCLAKSISDSGWNTFVNMLKYKGSWYGCRIIEIDRWFPSSKRCHICGYINDNLTLSDRSWLCPECNTNHDRDINASINILTFGRAGIARTILPSLCSSVARRNVICSSVNPLGEPRRRNEKRLWRREFLSVAE
jgi:putative transposase